MEEEDIGEGTTEGGVEDTEGEETAEEVTTVGGVDQKKLWSCGKEGGGTEETEGETKGNKTSSNRT